MVLIHIKFLNVVCVSNYMHIYIYNYYFLKEISELKK